MKKVRKIEVSEEDITKKLRVAAYCRVSTKYESQKSSIDLQRTHYEKYIQEQPNWLFVGVYVDYGSRGRIEKRTEFQKMIQKALNGEIDYIITKSISRFSGNTIDMLQTIRTLKEKGVTVWFEKENIRSTDKNIELIITIHTMLAQEEIRNMSENIQWGFKRRLEQNQIKTASGKVVWSKSVIQEMLCNEKYMGDCMLQKYFTEDYLSGKKTKNIGQRDRYYVHDSHQGIIAKEKFLEVTCEMNRRRNLAVESDGEMVKLSRKYNPQNVLGNILECEACGASYRRRTERGKVVYRCATRIEKGRETCKESPTVREEEIKEELGQRICGGEYGEEIVRKKISRVQVGKDGQLKILFRD